MALLWAFNAGFSSDFVGVSYSASTTTINGNTVDDFMGGSWVEGGAVSIPVYGPLSVGVTGDRIESYDGKIVGKSVGKTMGISAGCFGPLELHHKANATHNTNMLTNDVIRFNLFKYYEYIADEAIKWANN